MGAQDPAGYEIKLAEVDLGELGLRHAAGTSCPCRGKEHDLTLRIDPEEHGLHAEGDCPVGADTGGQEADGAIQALHEQAHPQGVLYWRNCRERGCVILAGY